MKSKNDLRKFAKDLRKTLDIRKISADILRIFLSSNLYTQANNIGIYYPFGDELDLRSLFLDNTKNYYLPKISQDGSLTFHPYRQGDNLEQNKYGIFEPISESINPQLLDTIIVPALICDLAGYRLGYGKGYYDIFFKNSSFKGNKLIFIPEELLVEKLCTDTWDIPANALITQKRIHFPS